MQQEHLEIGKRIEKHLLNFYRILFKFLLISPQYKFIMFYLHISCLQVK